MTTQQQWENLIGLTAVDADGGKIGKVGQVYLDDAAGQPEWVTVSTGMFGTRESFAPLYNSSVRDGQLVLAVPKELVKDAPNVDDDGHLEEAEVAALYQHYAAYLDPAASRDAGSAGDDSYSGRHADAGHAGGQGHDTSGPVTDDAMTRSEERLNVGTESVPAGRARLRKYVVTENVTTTVPVSHAEVRLEREPITDANRDAVLSGPGISEEEHEVRLHADRPGHRQDPGQSPGTGRLRPAGRARGHQAGPGPLLLRRGRHPGQDRLLRDHAVRAVHRDRRVRQQPDQRQPARGDRLPAAGLRRHRHRGDRYTQRQDDPGRY